MLPPNASSGLCTDHVYAHQMMIYPQKKENGKYRKMLPSRIVLGLRPNGVYGGIKWENLGRNSRGARSPLAEHTARRIGNSSKRHKALGDKGPILQ